MARRDRKDGITVAEHPELYSGSTKSLVAAAARATENGTFVAIYGQEFSTISAGNHMNVFEVGSVIPVPNGHFDELVTWLATNKDSTGAAPLLQFNHPDTERPLVDYGRDDFGNDERRWVQALDPEVAVIEILNAPALKDGTGFRAHSSESSFFHYLNVGFHLAPSVGHDNHYKNWGTSTDARVAILADHLTKADLLAALKSRHAYATEDKNLRIIFRANGALSGDIAPPPAVGSELALTVEVSDLDESNASYRIDVFQDRPGGDQARKPVETYTWKGNTAGPRKLEGVRFNGPGEFVTLRITQFSDDEHDVEDRAWTAPVWFESGGTRAVPIAPAFQIARLIPNPVGDDAQFEEVTIKNIGAAPRSLKGWQVRDAAGGTWDLGASDLSPGQDVTIQRKGQPMSMNNDGDTIELIDPAGSSEQAVQYGRVTEGQVIVPQ